ncbi:MAG: AMP-binding protein [Methylococcaceae bacterium]|nr:AMP-binding protein [Methylococcaceae bacterium]
MSSNNEINPWSTANIAAFEASLWREEKGLFTDVAWLELSWKEPIQFWRGLHDYWKQQQAVQTKSMSLESYDFYHDLLIKPKAETTLAYVWFDGELWETWSYAELRQAVDSLAASWEQAGVQAEETLAILHQQGPQRITAILAGLRLGLLITLLPPQGDSFVQHRLENLEPQWLVMDQLYRHRLAKNWQEQTLPDKLSSSPPMRQPYLYPAKAIVLQSFDPTSLTPDIPCLVDADTLYLGALRDGIFALGLKAGQACAAPD